MVIVILPLSISMVLRKEEDGKCVEEGGGALCGGGKGRSPEDVIVMKYIWRNGCNP